MCPLVLLALVATPAAADAPLVEKYLHSGQLALGEQALERELKGRPKDDQVRFGLGLIRLVRGVERLGQSLYEHGATGGGTALGLPRLLLLPQNPEPSAITYAKFRRILDDFRRDLDAAETTLAGVTDDNVTLPLRLEPIKLDFDGDGQATDPFLDVVKAVVGGSLDLLKKNPSFLVRFDRGDVAWFRSYCHLLMGLTDFALAFDFETEFRLNQDGVFPQVRPKFRGDDAERNRLLTEARSKTRVAEPARLGRFREHLLQMPKLNRETWRFVRAETDDDYEWLPNAKQKGVIGLPVRDNMVDAWLKAMDELEAVLDGKKLLPVQLVWPTGGKGLNVKTLLDDPPAVFDFDKVQRDGVDEKYLQRGPALDLDVLLTLWRLFDGNAFGMYLAYFN